MNLFLDIHALQPVSYNNINRDDLGFPKTDNFGGVVRGRVSSQCWKRATRLSAEAARDDISYRSRCAALDIHDELTSVHGWDSDLALFAGRQAMLAAGFALNAPKKNKGGEEAEAEPYTTKILLWYPRTAITDLASLCLSHRAELVTAHDAAVAKTARKKNKDAEQNGDEAAVSTANLVLPSKDTRDILIRRSSSINLFGRFLAEVPEGNVDGAVSVAHAFTVHPAQEEIDYFTAVDDRRARGTGHLATASFSSGTFYRYASVNLRDLAANLDSMPEAIALATEFAHHFLTSLPSGKQHSTAAFTLPDLVYLGVRTDRPVSLAAAFEAPVAQHRDGGYLIPARAALSAYAGNAHRFLGVTHRPFHAHLSLSQADQVDNLGTAAQDLAGLFDATRAALHQAATPSQVA